MAGDCDPVVTDKQARTTATNSRNITRLTFESIGSLIERYPSMTARSPRQANIDGEFCLLIGGITVSPSVNIAFRLQVAVNNNCWRYPLP